MGARYARVNRLLAYLTMAIYMSLCITLFVRIASNKAKAVKSKRLHFYARSPGKYVRNVNGGRFPAAGRRPRAPAIAARRAAWAFALSSPARASGPARNRRVHAARIAD